MSVPSVLENGSVSRVPYSRALSGNIHSFDGTVFPITPLVFKVIAVLLLLAMVVSLFSGLYFLYKDQGRTDRTLKALTTRISIWVVLFVILCAGIYTGVITPSNSVRPPTAPGAQAPN